MFAVYISHMLDKVYKTEIFTAL